MSRIGIDVDGVLRDFCGSLVDVIKEKYPHYLKDEFKPEVEPSLDGGMITEWYLANNFNCSKKELQDIYWKNHPDKIMANGAPMYGAVKKMYDLFEWAEENDHTLVCITSQKSFARHHTLYWLGKYGMDFDTVYFRRGREKWKVDVDYLVDDSPNNFDAWKKGRGMEEGFILMDAPYNQHIDSKYRIYALDEVVKIIEKK
tara:strand:- start:819 stop:1418 length:600 start_codon:yes stop_codon:yes gene_type:complete